ncbi:hypothetical protein MMC31_000889 [Peltigera leucophlebia]|nr:hypothetical protein [Peltigera leucophlebia]
MKWGCCLYIFAYLSTLSEAQDKADGCVTCALGDFIDSGLEQWVLPAVGALQFLVPGSDQGPDTTIPETDPEKQGTNDLPGSVDQSDIEIESIASPDKKCDPNGAQLIGPFVLFTINAARGFSQVQQLLSENVGIKFIEPDAEMEEDMDISSGVQKRRFDKFNLHRQSRVQKRVEPDFIHVVSSAALHLAYISTAPNRPNPLRQYTYFDSAGVRATLYWIDRQFYMSNPDLSGYRMEENRLMAEGISPEEWTRIPIVDSGGCMLSMIGGSQHGVIPLNPGREDGLQLKIVKVNPTISSFFSGIGAIITELELRTERNERVGTYTVIGTKIAQYPGTPIIVASGALYFSGPLHRPPASSFLTLYAPSYGTCTKINNDVQNIGISSSVAIITALAVDMLTVRAKLFIDNVALAPDEQKPEALRPVSAKIRDYLDSLAFDQGG